MTSWRRTAVVTRKALLQGVASMQHHKTLQFQIHLPIWRVYIERRMRLTVRPMRTAFAYWQLSVKLSAKLELYNRWMLRDFLTRWFSKSRVIVNRHRKQTFLQNWILVQKQKSSAVIHTTTAYIHQHSSLLSQGWNFWLSEHKHSLLTTGFLTQAYQHQLGTHFDKWLEKTKIHSRFSSQATLAKIQSVAHFNFKTCSKALELWENNCDQAGALSEAISYKNEASKRTSFKSWLSGSLNFKLLGTWYKTSTIWRYERLSRWRRSTLLSWRSWALNRRSRLELLEEKVHTTDSLQWVHANLESKSL